MSSVVRRALAGALWSSILAWLVPASNAQAGGLELMPGGTHSVGRGGAVAARPTNPMTVLQNPAGLGELASDQFMLDFDTAFHDMCFQPYGYYGWGVYLPDERGGALLNQDARRSEFGDPASAEYGNRHLDTVCNSAQVAPIPNASFSFHLTEALSIGFGIVAPVLVPGLQFGGKDGTIAAGGGARPTPTRYQLIHAEYLFGVSAVGGVSYRVLPELTFGLGLQIGAGSVRTNSAMALHADASPSDDVLLSIAAHDYFVPAVTFAVLVKPFPRITLMGSFKWTDAVNGSGDVIFTTNTYHQGASGTEFIPLKNDPIDLDSIRVELPWTATLGLRYAQPLPGSRGGDPLDSEIWDVELDVTYTLLAQQGRDNSADVGEDIVLDAARANGMPERALRVLEENIERFRVESHERNSVAVRLGGSYNPLPGKLGITAGAFVESRGVDASYATIETFAFGRLGLGVGVQLRLGSFDVSAAYAHIFQEEVTVAPPPHQPRQAATDDPQSGFDQRVYDDGELSQKPRRDPHAASRSEADAVASWQQPAIFETAETRRRVVNAGRYTASFDVLSVAFAHRF